MDEQDWYEPQGLDDVWRALVWVVTRAWPARLRSQREVFLWKIRRRLGYRSPRLERVDLEQVIFSYYTKHVPCYDRIAPEHRTPAVGQVHTWPMPEMPAQTVHDPRKEALDRLFYGDPGDDGSAFEGLTL